MTTPAEGATAASPAPAPGTTIVLAGESSSVPAARRFVVAALPGAPADVTDTAMLVTSELVANAVLHASGPVTLTVIAAGGGVRIEVADGSAAVPATKRYSEMSTTGRGLMLVDSLAADWGVEVRSSGKTVWAEVVEDDTPARP